MADHSKPDRAQVAALLISMSNRLNGAGILPMDVGRQRRAGAVAVVGRLSLAATAVNVSACSVAPCQNIMGSFFPSWMLCSLLGVISAILFRQLAILAGLGNYIVLPLLTYAAIAGAMTMIVWLTWFGH